MIKEIVLLDDEGSVLFALKLLLEALGFNVHDFQDPDAALAYVSSGKIADLFLCDLKMPKMNGLEVLKLVRESAPSLAFVLMSAHAGRDEIDSAQALGAAGFLAKPFTPDQLKQMVAELSPA